MCSWVFPSFSSRFGFRVLEPSRWYSLASWVNDRSNSPFLLKLSEATGSWFAVLHKYSSLIFYSQITIIQAFAQTAVDESPQLIKCCVSHSPCFGFIKEYCVNLGVKYSQLTGFSNPSAVSNCLENQGGNALFACSCPYVRICPCKSTTHLKYVKLLTSSRGCPSTVTWLLLIRYVLLIFVVSILMWRPVPTDVDCRHLVKKTALHL